MVVMAWMLFMLRICLSSKSRRIDIACTMPRVKQRGDGVSPARLTVFIEISRLTPSKTPNGMNECQPEKKR